MSDFQCGLAVKYILFLCIFWYLSFNNTFFLILVAIKIAYKTPFGQINHNFTKV